mmetsp:Transcript_5129/g.19019  ORF Transcript_5129/g.19019 Transcript_5129/m.19019 type:complete len:251 (+) Transcript_5129:1266-2018(+)
MRTRLHHQRTVGVVRHLLEVQWPSDDGIAHVHRQPFLPLFVVDLQPFLDGHQASPLSIPSLSLSRHITNNVRGREITRAHSCRSARRQEHLHHFLALCRPLCHALRHSLVPTPLTPSIVVSPFSLSPARALLRQFLLFRSILHAVILSLYLPLTLFSLPLLRCRSLPSCLSLSPNRQLWRRLEVVVSLSLVCHCHALLLIVLCLLLCLPLFSLWCPLRRCSRSPLRSFPPLFLRLFRVLRLCNFLSRGYD